MWVRHSIPWPLPSKPLPLYPWGFWNPCSTLVEHVIYHFSLSSFYWLSWCSNSTPDISFHFKLIIFPHVTFSAFILISSFKYFSIVPDFYMCSHLPFHMLWLFFPCALTLFMTFSKLLWHFIFLWLILVTFPSYPNAVYKLLYLLKSLSSLSSLSSSSGNYIHWDETLTLWSYIPT